MLSSVRALVRFVSCCALLVVSFVLCCALFLISATPMHAQNLRFTSPIYGVKALNGASAALTVLSSPAGMAVDAAGNFYIVDQGHRVVRKVDPTQTATLFAGTGGYGATGDGGPANLAKLTSPIAVATDLAGNVYIADSGSYSIRKVDTSGNISTIAGGNGSGSSGDGGSALAAKITPVALVSDLAGNLYVGDSASQTVRRIDTQGNITRIAGGGTPASGNGDGGPATSASLHVVSLALDANGNLYIGDNVGYVVRKVTPNGVISTFAGTGTYGISGNGGPATSAQLRTPTGLAVDAAGNVYIADGSAYAIRKVDSSGKISVFAGTLGTSSSYPPLDGTAADQAYLDSPRNIAISPDGEQLYFDMPTSNLAFSIPLHPEHFPQTRLGNTSQAQRLILENYGTSNINISAITFSGDFAAASTYLPQANPCRTTLPVYTGFNGYCTLDVVFKPTAEGIRSFPLTITDNDTNGSVSTTLSSTGLGSALAMTSGMMYIVAGDHAQSIVNRGDGGLATKADLSTPTGLVVDSSGNLYFSEYGFCQIRRVDGNTGILSTIAGDDPTNSCQYDAGNNDGGLATQAHTPAPGNLALDKNNNLYFAESWDSRIRKINLSTGIVSAFAGTSGGVNTFCGYAGDGGPAAQARLCAPTGMTFDAAGNFFFVDGGNNVVRKVNTSGTISTIVGTQSTTGSYSGDGGPATAAHFNSPQGIAVNAAGDIFISDTNNHVIRKVDHTTGIINIYAGQAGVTGYSGDGGLATQATLNYPHGIAMDAAGNLFIADYYNMVIRKVDPSGIITTVAGNNTVYDGFNGDALPATATDLAFPNLVAVSPSGYIFLSDGSNLVIREMTANGSLIFPGEPIGTTSPAQSVTIANVGNMPMHFDSQFPTGITGDFALASGGTCNFTAALAVGASCKVNITFTPTASGVRTGIFGLFDDGVASPQYVALTGTGTGQPKQQQSISFTSIPDHTYGDTSFPLTATATSGLPVTFSVLSGNATVSGSTVTITGVGRVTILANQAGDSTYGPAQAVSQTFNIAPATLLVSADNQTGLYGDAIVPLTYTITGFAYTDTAATVVTGTPSLITTATPTSNVGTYPIYLSPGTLKVTNNYTLTGADGTYTIKQARQTITLAAISDHVYGDAPFSVTASASSGLPVTLAIASGPATINGSTITVTGVGAVTVTASQVGDTNHIAASTQRTFNVIKANTTTALGANPVQLNFGSGSTLTATVTSATTGTPTGTVTFLEGSTQLGTATLTNGAATFSVTSFAGGTHSLTATYGGDANFNTSTSSATRVIAGDYTLVANPSTVNIKRGSSGSTTITLTPTGGYKGTVTLVCTNLPAEATCTFTPASVTADGSNTPLTMQLTIATTAPKVPGAQATVVQAGFSSALGLKSAVIGLILVLLTTFAWPQKRDRVRRLLVLLLMAAGAASLFGCGGAPTPVGGTPLGSTSIQISAANADAAHQLQLTVNVQ